MAEELKIVSLGSTSANDLPNTSAYDFIPNFNSTRSMRWLIVGNSGSGESLLVKNLLCRPEFGVEPNVGEIRFIIRDTMRTYINPTRSRR